MKKTPVKQIRNMTAVNVIPMTKNPLSKIQVTILNPMPNDKALFAAMKMAINSGVLRL
jgi:hypothetical protein